MLIGENFANLDQLPPWSSLVATPLPIEGGSGSPVRALALVPRGARRPPEGERFVAPSCEVELHLERLIRLVIDKVERGSRVAGGEHLGDHVLRL